MFRTRKLFRKDIEPRCAYCSRANVLDENNMSCRKRGIVPLAGSCRAFRYDPLRRIPAAPGRPAWYVYRCGLSTGGTP